MDRGRPDAAQVLANLLANASKFTRSGGHIWLTIELDPGGAAMAPAAVIRVRDDGSGIDHALLPRIFELFVQADSADRTRQGIGLGLALARRLVHLHGGNIEASSAGVGQGSEFTVRLPTIAAPAEQGRKAGETAARGNRATTPNGEARVLIVDDNADAAESLRMLLELAGHEVEIANTGVEATAHALRFRPSAILLDIGLPDKDGYTVARELRQQPVLDDTLIVAVSGYGAGEDVEKSRAAGCDDHLTKPVDTAVLYERIGQGRTRAQQHGRG